MPFFLPKIKKIYSASDVLSLKENMTTLVLLLFFPMKNTFFSLWNILTFCPIEKIGGWLTWLFFLFHSHYLTFVLKKIYNINLEGLQHKNKSQPTDPLYVYHCVFAVHSVIRKETSLALTVLVCTDVILSFLFVCLFSLEEGEQRPDRVEIKMYVHNGVTLKRLRSCSRFYDAQLLWQPPLFAAWANHTLEDKLDGQDGVRVVVNLSRGRRWSSSKDSQLKSWAHIAQHYDYSTVLLLRLLPSRLQLRQRRRRLLLLYY